MQLSVQNFSTLVEGMAASVQGAATQLLDLTVGSVLRAILEANASVGLWLQWLILQVLATTRLATSSGADCDSFGADFGFFRLPSVAATGVVTFSRFTPTSASFIPVGIGVSTASNSQSFLVVGDASNSAYSATSNGYTLAAGVSSIDIPVAASVPGVAGNLQAGAISLLNAAIAGVDTVTNLLAFTGGLDAESDTAFRARFGSYLLSLSRATNGAIGEAIAGVQQGLSYAIDENIDQIGNPQMGHFVVTIDDGTGAPPVALLSTVQQAVDAVRPVGSSFAVQKPVIMLADITMTIITSDGTAQGAAIAAVVTAIEAYVAALSIGATLSYTKLIQIAYAASASVIDISAVLLNGGAADLTPPLFGAIRTGNVVVG